MSQKEREAMQAALAYVRWTAFGECRTSEWDDPPPTAAEVNALLVAALAPPKCKCDLRTKLVGDGCSICNPKLAAELAAEVEHNELVNKAVGYVREYALKVLAKPGHTVIFPTRTEETDIALYATPQQPEPGWQLVPIEPTEAMCLAGQDYPGCIDVYKYMLKAAPKAAA